MMQATSGSLSKLLEAVTRCETLNAIALWILGRAYAEYNGRDTEISDKVISLWAQASLLWNMEAYLCLRKAYHNRYDGKLNVGADFEKAEHWYSEALKLGLKEALLYLGKLYHSKSAQTDEDAVMAYTYYNAFYMLTSQDKNRFSSLREEANQGMESMEGAAEEKEGRVKFFLALRQSNSALLERLSSCLKFS